MWKFQDIISFDLLWSRGEDIDVSKFFPLSEAHAIRSRKPLLDTIIEGEGDAPDLSVSKALSLSRFRTIATLDIARREFFEPGVFAVYLLDEKPRPLIIDICPPLYIPYGSIDVRGKPKVSEKKYGDIYRRSLPWSLHARRTWKNSKQYITERKKPILITGALFLSLSIPLLLYVKILIESSYTSLLSLQGAQNIEEIQKIIHSSRSGFERANIIFTPFRILPGQTLHLARIAIDGGLDMTRWLDRMALSIPLSASWWANITPKNTSENDLFRPLSKDISPLQFLGVTDPTKWLKEEKSNIVFFANSLEQAGNSYIEAENIDNPRASEIAHIGRAFLSISTLLRGYIDHESDVLALLGAETPERYIVFNQNRDEIRANGGFPGSIITFTLFRGNILDFRTDDVYYYDWNLYPFRELPPPGLALISGNYGLRDVNYYGDFHETLEKANTFIERSGDPTVTIGIALHQGLVEDILEKIGPVMLSGVTEPFTQKNFSSLMSTLVEARYGEKTSAKDILGSFIEAFIWKIYEKQAYDEVITTVESAVKDGEIPFASRNERIDNFLSTFRVPLPWEKPIDNTETVSGDQSVNTSTIQQSYNPNWVYPLLTSISGNKSDRLMTRLYTSETIPLGSCHYENKLTFTHTHGWNALEDQNIKNIMKSVGITDPEMQEKMLYIQWKGKNMTFIRVYTPSGATLTGSTAGITAVPSAEKNEFSFTLETPIGGTTSKILRYEITFPDCIDSKSDIVRWYRQPGLQNTKLKSR